MNRARMERGIREFLEGVLEGASWTEAEASELLAEAPARVAAAFAEDLLAGMHEDPMARLEPIELPSASGPVLLEGVRFSSVCAHHLLPYRGLAHVGFVPAGRHVGLGSIARLVDTLARRLTLQETLTSAIAGTLEAGLAPRTLAVRLEAEHLCLSVRGARKTGHRFVTEERRGERSGVLEAWIGGLASRP